MVSRTKGKANPIVECISLDVGRRRQYGVLEGEKIGIAIMVFLCQCNSLSNASSPALSPSPACFLPSPSKMPLIRVLSNQRANAHALRITAQIPTPVHARLLCVSRNAKTSPPQLYASFRDHKITCLRSMEHTAHARIRSVHASSIAYSHMVPVRRATERVNGYWDDGGSDISP